MSRLIFLQWQVYHNFHKHLIYLEVSKQAYSLQTKLLPRSASAENWMIVEVGKVYFVFFFLPFLNENTLRIWENRIKYNTLQAPFWFQIWLLLLPWRDIGEVSFFIHSQSKTKLKYSLDCQLLTRCESPDTAGVQVFGRYLPQFPWVCGQWQWKGSGWECAAVSADGDCWVAVLGGLQWSTRWSCSPPHPDAVLRSLYNTKIGVGSELSLIIKNNSSFGKQGLILSLTYWSPRNLSYWANLNFLETLLPQSKCGIFIGAYFSLVGIMLFWIKMQPIAFTNFTNPISTKFKSLYVTSAIMRITTEALLHVWRSGVNSCVRSQLAWSKTFQWSWENVDMVNRFRWGKTNSHSRDPGAVWVLP